MNKFFQTIGQSVSGLLRDEEGAQVVEYALIIAVVSIALVVALKALTADDGDFGTFIGRVGTCLTSTTGGCV